MKYIVCQKPGEFRLLEKEKPTVAPGKALLKIKAIGICGTDLHAYAGNQAFFKYPRILGHELGAEVVALGAGVDQVAVGDKVSVMPYLSCGQCSACRRGKTNCCSNIQVLGVHTDGGMQEYISVPATILLKVNELSYAQLAIIEPLAIGAHALARAEVNSSDTVVVVGCGPIGLGIMKLAKIQGATVIALDRIEDRLAFAKSAIGVDHTVIADDKAPEVVAQLTNGELATVVFDATGNKYALEAGINYMAHGGKYVLVGLSKGELTFMHPAIHAKETSLLCSRNATIDDFNRVIDVLKADQFPVETFISTKVPFTEMIGHFDNWLSPDSGVIKALVEW